jgi:hypothetical protein
MANRVILAIPGVSSIATVSFQQQGAVVNGAQEAVNTVTVHSPNGLAVDDLFVYALDNRTVFMDRIFTCSARDSTSVTFTGAAFTFPDKGVLINLGTDSVTVRSDGTWPPPNYDGSNVNAFEDASQQNVIANARVTVLGLGGRHRLEPEDSQGLAACRDDHRRAPGRQSSLPGLPGRD